MSFPESNFVWNCPFVVLYYSKDGKVGGEDYCEYALIKLDGESGGSNLFAENRFEMKKKTFFKDWNEWKSANRNGLEYEVDFHRRGNIVTVSTETLGLYIQNTTIIKNDARNAPKEVYVALTGDKCALTDIRLR